VRDPRNPVLREGDSEAPDARGLLEPEVVHDPGRGLYLMWYAARALFDESSICHAVSTDGVTWHRFPSNPVVKAGSVGLSTMGSPAVDWSPGRIRMWVHGTDTSVTTRIYGLVNGGEAPK
jgi:hypothetical protein